jgi:hypothetical protein
MPLYSQHFRFGGTKFQFQCDPLEPVDEFELTIGFIDYDDEERLDSDVLEAALSIQKFRNDDDSGDEVRPDSDDEERLESDVTEAELSIFRSDDDSDDEERPDSDIRSNNWPLRHLTRERVFLRVVFDIEESFRLREK